MGIERALFVALLGACVAACEGVAPMGPAPPPSAPGGSPQGDGTGGPQTRGARPGRAAAGDDEAGAIYKVPIGKSPTRGSASALVTIVEFADYQCPYCLRAEETLRALSAEYSGTIRIVFKNEPLGFHEGAEPAAEASLEVRDEKGDAAFWTMHDLLLENQRELNVDEATKMAVGLGARADLVRAAIANHAHQDEIDADQDLADDLQANGTPHFFVNGRRLPGAMPKAVFASVIDEEIERARGLLKAGTPPPQLYDALTKDGRGPPEPERIAVTALPQDDPSRGPATARVTVHEFGDFQCPYCSVVEPTVRKVASTYQDTVRLVWHDLPLPFHENALPAARAAREARRQGGDAAFWRLHDMLLANPKMLSRADLDARARELGLDARRWKNAVDGDVHDRAIESDRKAAAAVGLQGTPSFVVVGLGATQGYVLEGAQGFSRFRRLIERALGEASGGASAAVGAAGPSPSRKP